MPHSAGDDLLLVGEKELLALWHLTEKLQWLTWTTTGLHSHHISAAGHLDRRHQPRRGLGSTWTSQPPSAALYMSILPRIGRYLWLMTSPLSCLTRCDRLSGYFGFMLPHQRIRHACACQPAGCHVDPEPCCSRRCIRHFFFSLCPRWPTPPSWVSATPGRGPSASMEG